MNKFIDWLKEKLDLNNENEDLIGEFWVRVLLIRNEELIEKEFEVELKELNKFRKFMVSGEEHFASLFLLFKDTQDIEYGINKHDIALIEFAFEELGNEELDDEENNETYEHSKEDYELTVEFNAEYEETFEIDCQRHFSMSKHELKNKFEKGQPVMITTNEGKILYINTNKITQFSLC